MNHMNPSRRPLAKLSLFGITSLNIRNPYMIMWWSAAFPGFGHMLLNQYLRGTFLTLSEVVFNSLAHINEAIIYSFCGKFAQAKALLDPRWILGYIIIFFIAIWDSYRSAIYQNKLYHIAQLEQEPLPSLKLFASEVQYIQPKSPLVAAVFSIFFPGMGQLYNHRIGLAFYGMFWWWLYLSLSHVHEAFIAILNGKITESVSFLRSHWLLFLPSVFGGSIYHAYIKAKEHNLLFSLEQRQYLVDRYSSSAVQIFGKSGEHL
jgi:TM2 domain.